MSAAAEIGCRSLASSARRLEHLGNVHYCRKLLDTEITDSHAPRAPAITIAVGGAALSTTGSRRSAAMKAVTRGCLGEKAVERRSLEPSAAERASQRIIAVPSARRPAL